MSAFIPDQLDQMSKKELLEFARTAHEENVKLSKRCAELESYNVRLANESHEYQQRCDKLEKQRETAYEAWQVKYQQLKNSMSLINCYECSTPVHELSPRSRCFMCEYGRAQFNERENEQLRKEQEK